MVTPYVFKKIGDIDPFNSGHKNPEKSYKHTTMHNLCDPTQYCMILHFQEKLLGILCVLPYQMIWPLWRGNRKLWSTPRADRGKGPI